MNRNLTEDIRNTSRQIELSGEKGPLRRGSLALKATRQALVLFGQPQVRTVALHAICWSEGYGRLQSRIPFRFQLFRNAFIPTDRPPASAIELFPSSVKGCLSIDNTYETDFLRWLAGQPQLFRLLLGSFGMEGYVCFDTGVSHPFLPRHGGGDIDLLAVADADPREAVAIQAKRFKVSLCDGGERVSLDGEKLDSLIQQCNDTILCGFDRVYGLALVMIDGQLNSTVNVLHRGTSENTFRRLYQFIKSRPLNPAVGMVFVEVVQPTGAHFQEFGLLAVGVDQHARHLGQTGELSERVGKWADRMVRKDYRRMIDLPPVHGGIPIGRDDEIGLRLVRRPS